MTDQGLMIILTIVGSFMTLVVGIFGHFFKTSQKENGEATRQVQLSIAELQKEIAVLIAGTEAYSNRMHVAELKAEKIENEVVGLRNRFHDVLNEVNVIKLTQKLNQEMA